jgi:hypothetical protein
MRILRKRRGFTTNSSGANEFLPDGGRPDSASTTPAPSTSASASAQPVITQVQSWGQPPEMAPSARASNLKTVGVASVVVAGALLAVPVIRFLTRKKKEKKEDGGPDAG